MCSEYTLFSAGKSRHKANPPKVRIILVISVFVLHKVKQM